MGASLSLVSEKMFRENWPDLEVLQSDTTLHCFNCIQNYTHIALWQHYRKCCRSFVCIISKNDSMVELRLSIKKRQGPNTGSSR